MITSNVDISGIDMQNLPRHIGVIMDGNGRWAKKRGLPRTAGHVAGAESFKKTATFCGEIGIPCLTVYAFSTENWSRPKKEVDTLMSLFNDYIDNYYAEFADKNMQIRIIGERDRLSKKLLKRIEKLEKDTEQNTGLKLNIALNYGGRQEMVSVAQKLVRLALEGKISPEDITVDTISNNLYTKNQPDADLVIRTSCEYRTSNFLLWQAAYAEYVFTDVLWPDFSEKDIVSAIEQYQKRNRRFGGV